MGTAIRIKDDIYLAAQRVAGAENRSIPQQIEFWALIGKTALENPDLPIEFVRELLISKHTDRALAEPFVAAGGASEAARAMSAVPRSQVPALKPGARLRAGKGRSKRQHG